MTRNILVSPHKDALRQFAWSKTLAAFDYDGTLAPIVAKPDGAFLRATTRRLLAQLAALYPVVVLSGRSQADAERRLARTGVQKVLGNHGASSPAIVKRARRTIHSFHAVLREQLRGVRGVEIELKEVSIAVHYRRSRQRHATRDTIRAVLSQFDDMHVIAGKLVFNILPREAPHKGTALRRVRAELLCDTAIYVGDDQSDEDVFTLDEPGRLLKIRVGGTRNTAADYHVRYQTEVDNLLRTLIELRERAPFTQREAV